MDIKPLWTCQHIRLKQCREGAMMYTINDTYIGRALDKYGEISRDEVLFLQQLTRPGMTVLEVGANIGVFTVPLARFVHPGGRVIAFEPQRIMYQMLCGNIALNAIDNVVAHNCAAGRSSGSVAVPSVDYGKPGNFGAVSLARSSQGDIVPLVTIDSLALPSCHLIKVDVEGMELDVLEGASSTLRQFRPLLYVENDQPEKSPPADCTPARAGLPALLARAATLPFGQLFWRRGEYLRECGIRRYGLRPAQRPSGDHR